MVFRASEATERLRQELARAGIPGATAAVGCHAEILWTAAEGLADVENAVPVRDDTVFRAASLSKPITAVAAMQLVERGRMRLEDDVQQHAPEFPPQREAVRVGALMSHTSGLRPWTPEEDAQTRHFDSLSEALDLFSGDPLVCSPGTEFCYSGPGVTLLGRCIEGASGMSYPAYVREHVLAAAKMTRTQLDDVFAIIPGRAQGYRRGPEGPLCNSDLVDPSFKWPSGGWSTTAVDMVRFGLAVMAAQLLGPAFRDQMFAPQRLRDGRSIMLRQQGIDCTHTLGWYLSHRGGDPELWHLGGMRRVSTALYLRPRGRVAVCVLCNLEQANLLGLVSALSDFVGF
jgi:serine beta-lactamase-like protein LACTB